MENIDPENLDKAFQECNFMNVFFFLLTLESIFFFTLLYRFPPPDYGSFYKMALFAKYVLRDCIK